MVDNKSPTEFCTFKNFEKDIALFLENTTADDTMLMKYIDKNIFSVSDKFASNYISLFFGKTNDKEFNNSQENIFDYAEKIYTIATKAEAVTSNYIYGHSSNEFIKEQKFTFQALQKIHQQAYEIYNNIITSLRYNCIEMAFARWRSLYELAHYAYFIREQGEKIAEQFVKQGERALTFSKYKWTKGFKSKSVKITKITHVIDFINYCSFGKQWKDEYNLACNIIHTSPEIIFNNTFDEYANAHNINSKSISIFILLNHVLCFLIFISGLFFTIFPSSEICSYFFILLKYKQILSTKYAEFQGNILE